MLERRSAERPQRILQTFGQSDIALATQDDMRMLEAGVGQSEMIQPVIKRQTCDGDAQVGHVGKIRQSHPAWFMDLAEDHLLIGAMYRPPGADAALQRATGTGRQAGMAALHLLEDRN